MCKYTHIFFWQKAVLYLKINLSRSFICRSCFLYFCVTNIEAVWGLLFFFSTMYYFYYAAHRKEMHTIYKLNILFISKAFKVQSCIHQFSWTQFQAGWITSCTTGREDRCCFCTETPSSALACISFSWLPVFPPISWGSYGIFFFLLQDYQRIFLLTVEDYALFLTSHTCENPPTFHCTLK